MGPRFSDPAFDRTRAGIGVSEKAPTDEAASRARPRSSPRLGGAPTALPLLAGASIALLLLVPGCAASGSHSESLVPTSPGTDIAARCEQAMRDDSPIVTEWGASKKAYLEGLIAGPALAVAYSGCELRIIEGCQPEGHYSYRRTTLATDTFEIRDTDDLYAKLPLGALGLQAQLARSGRLSVRTTVAGRYQLDSTPTQLPNVPACQDATHVVVAMSVGAFSLLGGGAMSAGGSASASLATAGAKSTREENVVREAGDAAKCGAGTDLAPNSLCASPIQVFLAPIRPNSSKPAAAAIERDAAERRAREKGVLMRIPGPSNPSEQWTLYDASGSVLCSLPCTRWVPPRSGYYVERQATSDREGVRIDVPNDLPGPAGSTATAEYGPERGMPFLSKLTFYGVGIPSAALGVGFGVAYLAGAGKTDDPYRHDQQGFFLLTAIMFTAYAAASSWWFEYSDEKHFRVHTTAPASPAPSFAITLGPGFAMGTF